MTKKKKKLGSRVEAYLYLMVTLTLFIWVVKGWKYAAGLFLLVGIVNQLRVIIFGRKQDEE